MFYFHLPAFGPVILFIFSIHFLRIFCKAQFGQCSAFVLFRQYRTLTTEGPMTLGGIGPACRSDSVSFEGTSASDPTRLTTGGKSSSDVGDVNGGRGQRGFSSRGPSSAQSATFLCAEQGLFYSSRNAMTICTVPSCCVLREERAFGDRLAIAIIAFQLSRVRTSFENNGVVSVGRERRSGCCETQQQPFLSR